MLELVFRIIEVVLQFLLVIFAGVALLTWKRDIRGKDRYKLAKDLLVYTKGLRFLIHSKNNSLHQIYLNDILVDRNKFYNDQLTLIENEKVYFDRSIWGLFNHINPRSDMSLPEKVRTLLYDLCPTSSKHVSSDKSQYTYIQLFGTSTPEIDNFGKDVNLEDIIFEMDTMKDLTIKEYFVRWEKLLIELHRLT